MVILYDLGVSLSFYNKNSSSCINIEHMAESIDEYGNKELTNISFKEYEDVYISFSSSSNDDKLIFDGIDLMPSESSETDENGNLYLKPNKDYTLFENSSNYYAMRVGRYELKIIHGEKTYYQWFNVLPKNVDSSEWLIMQKELEDEIQGLSTDIIRKNIALGNIKKETLPSKELYKFFVIKKHFKNILSALLDIKTKPKYRIVNKYELEPLYRATYIDNITVKDYLMKGTGEDRYKIPKRVYDYDLPENRWLKKIINEYEKELRAFILSTEAYLAYVKDEIEELKKYEDSNKNTIYAKRNVLSELNKYLDTARIILNTSELVKSQEWYKTVSDVKSLAIPHVLVFDVRYNAFYKMYKELHQDNITMEWSENYAYSWKLSSRMYEIWCFIKICRFLISDEIGFEAKGWIFDEYKDRDILVPDLGSGTKVEFYKNNIEIKLYYDTIVPRSSEKTNMENNPVFSLSNHIKPDMKLDIYIDNIYWSTIILEVKYRNINNLWNYNDTKFKEQIDAYKRQYRSKYSNGMNKIRSEEFVINKIEPVDKVWVLNPTRSSLEIDNKKDKGIKFVQLIPGENFDSIINELKEEIKLSLDLDEL